MKKKTTKPKKVVNTENTIKDEEVKKALMQSKIPFQRLGQGLHNGVFYYGTQLKYDNKPISAIVTSDKKLYLSINYIHWKCNSCGYATETTTPSYEKIKPPKSCNCTKISYQDWEVEQIVNPIRDEFKLNYRTEFNEEAVDYVWQTEDIKLFLKGGFIKKDLKEIYEDIVEINKKYVDHLNPASHQYIACWIIGTYCYTLFEQYGRLYQRAERGSGKTKQSRIIKNLAFNPMWITKGTESSIFRDAEATCGTFIIDNMDKLHEELKRSMEHLIETGWMHDATYRLTNMDKDRTQKFLSYTSMNINNIYGLDENTIDKTFEIGMLKSVNKNIERAKPTTKSENWEYLRNSLRYWVLTNWQKISKSYNEITADFSGRQFDVVEGVLTIAKLINEETYKDIQEYVQEKITEELIDLENNKSYMIFSRIWKMFDGDAFELNVFLKDISNELFPSFYPSLLEGTKDYNDKKRNFSRYIGTIIRGVPMFRKGGCSQGRTYIKVEKKHLYQYMKLQRFIDDEGILITEKEEEPKEKDKNHNEPVVLPTSSSPTSPTSSTSSTPNNKSCSTISNTIFNNNNNKKDDYKGKVEQVEAVEQVEQLNGIGKKELKPIMEEFESDKS